MEMISWRLLRNTRMWGRRDGSTIGAVEVGVIGQLTLIDMLVGTIRSMTCGDIETCGGISYPLTWWVYHGEPTSLEDATFFFRCWVRRGVLRRRRLTRVFCIVDDTSARAAGLGCVHVGYVGKQTLRTSSSSWYTSSSEQGRVSVLCISCRIRGIYGVC